MWSYGAERLVEGDVAAAGIAVADLVASTWGSRARVILDDPAGERLDAISSVDGPDQEADVWLTWQFTPVPGGTRVRVRLDELERGPDPRQDLAELLDALALKTVRPTAAVDGDDGPTPPADRDTPGHDG